MKLNRIPALLCVTLLFALLSTGARAQEHAAAKAAPKVPDLVETAFRQGDFAELERLYAIYGKPGLRSPLTGASRIDHFWQGIGEVDRTNLRVTEAYFSQLDALTQKWAADNPRSVVAQLLYANSLKAHAWFHRGEGYANTVSPAAWAGFRQYLELALDQLRRSEDLCAKDSSWNQILLSVGQGLGWDIRTLLAVFESGVARDPEHDDLYFQMLSRLLPKWGGDLKTVDRFIASATQRMPEQRGTEMYARLYAGVSYQQVEQSLFSDTRASWPKMKAGFEDLLSRYPHADHRNMFAYFACMADDRQTLRQQLDLIGDSFERIFWGPRPERRFDECKALAQNV